MDSSETMSKEKEEENILEIFKKNNALLKGHFICSSGLHTDTYFQCARILQSPKLAAYVCQILAKKLINTQQDSIDLVVSPALGGILVGYELARILQCNCIFVERVKKTFQLRRGFNISHKVRYIIAEDVITTGLSTMEVIRAIEEENKQAQLVGVTSLVDRTLTSSYLQNKNTHVDFGVPYVALVRAHIETYDSDSLPAHLQNIPAVKPGSRQS